MDIQYIRASSDDELHQILDLQKQNTFFSITHLEKEKEGFITVSHDFDILKRMNAQCQHIIAKHDNRVVGYALAMLPSFRNEIPVLVPMFEVADSLLVGKRYIIMGQICVNKDYRKKGIFRRMYAFYKAELQHKFDCLFTEVATHNQRSLQAHLSIGFRVIKTQTTDGISWELMEWDWS